MFSLNDYKGIYILKKKFAKRDLNHIHFTTHGYNLFSLEEKGLYPVATIVIFFHTDFFQAPLNSRNQVSK